jgi:hypothetical protein
MWGEAPHIFDWPGLYLTSLMSCFCSPPYLGFYFRRYEQILKDISQSVSYSDRLRAGRPGFDSCQGQDIFLYLTASRSAVGSTQPPIKSAGSFPRGWSGRDVKLTAHLHPVSKSRIEELHLRSPIRLQGVMLNWLSTVTNLPLPFKEEFISAPDIYLRCTQFASRPLCFFSVRL